MEVMVVHRSLSLMNILLTEIVLLGLVLMPLLVTNVFLMIVMTVLDRILLNDMLVIVIDKHVIV